ncbi:MAG: hypothetical protein LC655_00190 [Bacteroidales bacterium]|nr:hypothetical protein [Bacteroidales bacterium]
MVSCFPQRVTRMAAEGTKASSVTADFKYEEERLDRIVWSNFQTYFNSYDESGKLVKVARKNVQSFRKLESRITYERELAVRTDDYRMKMDRFTREDLDTMHMGYRLYEYDGDRLMVEKVYEKLDDSDQMELTFYKEYTYDLSGNIVQYVSMDDVQGDTIEAFSYTYDTRSHPYSSLDLPFKGESHVNNILKKTNLLKGLDYVNQVVYSPTGFPEQINVKQDNYMTEVVSIDYTCR